MENSVPSLPGETQKDLEALFRDKKEDNAAILEVLERYPMEESIGFLLQGKKVKTWLVASWVVGGILLLLTCVFTKEAGETWLHYCRTILTFCFYGFNMLVALLIVLGNDPYLSRKVEVLGKLAERGKGLQNRGVWLQALRDLMRYPTGVWIDRARTRVIARVTGLLMNLSEEEASRLSLEERENLVWLLRRAKFLEGKVEEPFTEEFVVAGLVALLPFAKTEKFQPLGEQFSAKGASERIRAVVEEYVLVGKQR